MSNEENFQFLPPGFFFLLSPVILFYSFSIGVQLKVLLRLLNVANCVNAFCTNLFSLSLEKKLCSFRSMSSTVSLHHTPVLNTIIYMRSIMIDIKTGKCNICGKDKGTEPTVSGEDVWCPKDLVVAIKIQTFKSDNVNHPFSPRGGKLWLT